MSPQIQFNSSAVRPGDCIGEGWSLIKDNYGLFFAMGLVSVVIVLVLSLIPYVGSVINQIIAGPLLCGIYIALLAKMRREPLNFSMLFEGFNRFLPSALIVFIQSLPWFLVSLGALLFVSSDFGAADSAHFQTQSFPPFLDRKFIIVIGFLWFAAFALSLVLQVLLYFAIPLVAEYNLGFIEAVKTSINAALSNIGGIILLIILEILMMIGGVFLLCIGFLFVLPVVYAANIIAYKQVFPGVQPFLTNEPPQPDAYGGTYGMPQQ